MFRDKYLGIVRQNVWADHGTSLRDANRVSEKLVYVYLAGAIDNLSLSQQSQFGLADDGGGRRAGGFIPPGQARRLAKHLF